MDIQAGQIAIETPASGRGTLVALTLPCVAGETKIEDPQAQTALRA